MVIAAYIGGFLPEHRGLVAPDPKDRPNARFHGRVEGTGRACDGRDATSPASSARRCSTAPRPRGDGPGGYRYMCLDHVREFNAKYNFFTGMSTDEIHDAQRPYRRVGARDARVRVERRRPPAALEPISATRSTRSARGSASGWRRSARTASRCRAPTAARSRCSGLDTDADRTGLRTRYSELVRKFHPDRNGGDRSMENALQEVIAAYQQLKVAAFACPAFAPCTRSAHPPSPKA